MKWTVLGFILLFSFGCSKNAGDDLRTKEASAEMSAFVGIYELTAEKSDAGDGSSRRIILRGDGTFVEGTVENPELNTGTWQVPQADTETGNLVEDQEIVLSYSKGQLIDQVLISRLSTDDRLSMVAKIVEKERQAIPLPQQDSFKKVLSGLHPLIPFLIALSLLAMFIWYFGTDSDHRQRWIGTLLTLGIVGFCVYSVMPPEKKIKRGMDLAGGARFTLKLGFHQVPKNRAHPQHSAHQQCVTHAHATKMVSSKMNKRCGCTGRKQDGSGKAFPGFSGTHCRKHLVSPDQGA